MSSSRAVTASGAARPAIWPVWVGFLAGVLVSQILGGIALAALFLAHWLRSAKDPANFETLYRDLEAFVRSPTSLLTAGAVSAVTLIGVSLVGARLAETPAVTRLRLGPSTFGWGKIALAALGGVALSEACVCVISIFDLHGMGVLDTFSDVLSRATPGVLVVALVVVGVVAPIGEETFFRGFVLTRLSARWHRLAAIAVTALLFGIMHIDPVQGSFAFLLGLYLGWLTESSGSIRPAIAVHAVNNTLSVVGSRLITAEPTRQMSFIALGVSLAVFGAIFTLLWRRRPPAAVAS